ncbi:MAG: hypothetical protein IPK04_14385 [Bdellovibrionales bacterium]|nr:hypothetical protein [Bdellovibrionales bacterium]
MIIEFFQFATEAFDLKFDNFVGFLFGFVQGIRNVLCELITNINFVDQFAELLPEFVTLDVLSSLG